MFVSVYACTVYACVCSICQKPVTFTAHCVLTFCFKMTTSQSRATTMAEREEEERRKKKRKGRIKDGGKAEGRWQVCNKLRKGNCEMK